MKRLLATWPLLLVAAILVAVLVAIDRIDVAPRRLAPYVALRAAGHRPIVHDIGDGIRGVLEALDRGRQDFHRPMPIPAETPADQAAPRRSVIVGSTEEALHAIGDARPGDVITFVPGTYRFEGAYIDVREPGTADAPITVRGDAPGNVVLEFDMVEGFLVSAPYWRFENLTIRGVCANHSDCEHAFHVVGNATHFVARHDTVVDFNAHFKINGSRGRYPDDGLLDDNVIRNTSERVTGNPVTLIDLVAASHWRIVGNRISDFVKTGSDRVSYGAFVKGAGVDNRFLRNVVVCEDRLRGMPGQRVGLSLGGGGTSREACRDHRCVVEQEKGVIASNLIASCSDDGIYLNRAAMSSVTHNTLIDTAGITARFGESSADVEGNLVDGVIRAVFGAAVHETDNRVTRMSSLYLGWHPVRRLFVDAASLDLHWRRPPPRRQSEVTLPPDLCGADRPPRPAYGAFEDISRCASASP